MSFKFPKINHDEIQKRFKENLNGDVKKFTKDERFYALTTEKGDGSYASVIRWLPGKTVNGVEQLNYATLFRHFLRVGKGNVLSTICPSTVGGKCPICEWNRAQDDSDIKSWKIYPFRKTKYISNVMILEETNPEVVNKVMLFEYGKQVMGILEAKLYPKKTGSRMKQPLLYYDWDAGANFDLIYSKGDEEYPHWKDSEFLAPSSIMDIVNEKDLDPATIVDGLQDLDAIVASLKIPSYEELQRDLFAWLESNNLPTGNATAATTKISDYKAKELQSQKKPSLAIAVAESKEEAGTEEDLNEVVSKGAIAKKLKAVKKVAPETEKKEKTKEVFKDFKSFMKEDKEKEE